MDIIPSWWTSFLLGGHQCCLVDISTKALLKFNINIGRPGARTRYLPLGSQLRYPLGQPYPSYCRVRPLVSSAAFCNHLSQAFAPLQTLAMATYQSLRKWHHRLSAVPSRPTVSRPSRSAQPFGHWARNYEIRCHVTVACATHATPSVTPRRKPTYSGYHSTKFEPNPSIGLACTLGYNFFARVCAIARGTCHVQPIGPKPLPSSFRRSGASNDYSPVPIRPAVWAPEA